MHYAAVTIAILVLVILVLAVKREKLSMAEYGIVNPSPAILARMRAAAAKLRGDN